MPASEREWVGVAFRLSAENFLVAREETREVLGLPFGGDARAGREALDPRRRQRARPVAAGGRPARVPRRRRDEHRAQHARAGGAITAKCRPVCWSTRCSASAASPTASSPTSSPPTIVRCERYLAGAFRRGAESWPVFSLRTLLESTEFLQAAASDVGGTAVHSVNTTVWRSTRAAQMRDRASLTRRTVAMADVSKDVRRPVPAGADRSSRWCASPRPRACSRSAASDSDARRDARVRR